MEGQHIRAKRKPELVRSENVAENGKRGSKDWGQKVGKFGLRKIRKVWYKNPQSRVSCPLCPRLSPPS